MKVQRTEEFRDLMREAALRLFDLMRTVEKTGFSMSWRGKREAISYEDYIKPFALILAIDLLRKDKIRREDLEDATMMIEAIYFEKKLAA